MNRVGGWIYLVNTTLPSSTDLAEPTGIVMLCPVAPANVTRERTVVSVRRQLRRWLQPLFHATCCRQKVNRAADPATLSPALLAVSWVPRPATSHGPRRQCFWPLDSPELLASPLTAPDSPSSDGVMAQANVLSVSAESPSLSKLLMTTFSPPLKLSGME